MENHLDYRNLYENSKINGNIFYIYLDKERERENNLRDNDIWWKRLKIEIENEPNNYVGVVTMPSISNSKPEVSTTLSTLERGSSIVNGPDPA